MVGALSLDVMTEYVVDTPTAEATAELHPGLVENSSAERGDGSWPLLKGRERRSLAPGHANHVSVNHT